MQKVRLEKEQELSLNSINVMTDNIGFIDEDGNKGFTRYVGSSDGVSAISTSKYNYMNRSYGKIDENNYSSIESLIELKGSCHHIVELYRFDDSKELFKWLSED